jgi:4-diphosphocytidyl-2-C-methyl-D-erythritol kinase
MRQPPLICESPAKLNLFLHITGRDERGYHLLQTVFQLIDLCDTLEFRAAAPGDLSLRCDTPGVPLDDNLVLRAVRALREEVGDASLGVDITLHKRIPLGGGLGGGSSNAGITLLALNRLWGLDLETDRLARIGLALGADVPLFVHGRSAWAEGVGERLEPLDLPLRHYLILWPGVEVSTTSIFAHQQLTRDSRAIKIADFLAGRVRNDCESVVRGLYPAVDEALNWLGRFGQARLTGTGSCVFVEFEDRALAGEALKELKGRFRGYVASGVDRIPTPRQA